MQDALGLFRLHRYISSYMLGAEDAYKQCDVI